MPKLRIDQLPQHEYGQGHYGELPLEALPYGNNDGDVVRWDGIEGSWNMGPPQIRFQWVFTVPGVLTTGADKAAYFVAGYDYEIDEVRIHVGTAPTGVSILVDVNKDGVTAFTTQANRPEIAVSENDDTSDDPDGGDGGLKDEVITIDIDQVGSTVPGADLSVFVRGRYLG